MNIGLAVNNFSNYSSLKHEKAKSNLQNHQGYTATRPSFGEKKPDGMTAEAAAALAAQNITTKQTVPDITEKDINFSITCLGHGQVKGNTREVNDYRAPLTYLHGNNWCDNFVNPYMVQNKNLDEKRNGETTALVFHLHPKTQGLRRNDNMTMVLNGNVSKAMLGELIYHMGKAGILNPNMTNNVRYFVNSEYPGQFMSNPKIKTVIADFFRQKKAEQVSASSNVKEAKDSKKQYNLKVTDINISDTDCKQNKDNKKVVKDYLRDFLKNDKKLTVMYEKYTEKNQEKDMTVILVPATNSKWDCITITIDKKIQEQDCKNFLNYLIENKTADTENKNFRTAIVEYLNNL